MPGRRIISTPRKPTAIAERRRQPTGSPSAQGDIRVTSRGAEKTSAVASASGIRLIAPIPARVPPARNRERRMCIAGRPVLTSRIVVGARKIGTVSRKWKR